MKPYYEVLAQNVTEQPEKKRTFGADLQQKEPAVQRVPSLSTTQRISRRLLQQTLCSVLLHWPACFFLLHSAAGAATAVATRARMTVVDFIFASEG
jgi:hypothetical protein